jgi:putative FmdB family regulatory protein
MPTYDYECRACGYRFERFQKITEDPVAECPECGGEVERLIGGGAGLLFKGEGFYATDYRSKGPSEDEPGSSCCPGGTCCSDGTCD